MTKLRDIASAVRSANAGASLRTFDVIFDRVEDFRRVVEAEAVSPSVVARLYAVPVDEAKVFIYEPACAIKVTIPRNVMAGNPDDTDIERQAATRPASGNRRAVTPSLREASGVSSPCVRSAALGTRGLRSSRAPHHATRLGARLDSGRPAGADERGLDRWRG